MRRRKAIMAKYSKQVEELARKKEPSTFYIVLGVAVVQISIAAALSQSELWVKLVVAYTVGAILNHMTQVLVYDLTHYTAFESPFWNRIGAIMCNLPTLVPSAIAFGIYHNDHHLGLGRTDRDTDLPSKWEITFFNTPIKKFLYICLLPFFYGIRPMALFPHPPTKWEIINLVTIFTSDYLIWYNFGGGALLYLIISTYFSLGPHPCALHFIAEHYEFVQGQETYNYYGIWNFFNLNLGYHTEHHDFPWMPWSQLPKLRTIAPEFYDTVPYHTSYLRVGLKYIFDSEMGAFARIKNNLLEDNTKKA
jgi:sphingolipid delta-4 desaturase